MEILVMACLGALTGASVLFTIQTLRGVRMFSNAGKRSAESLAQLRYVTVWLSISIVVAALVFVVSGWASGAFWAVVGVMTYARRRRLQSPVDDIAKVEAIASWTEQIRDTMSAALGLQASLVAASAQAPKAIRPELRIFSARLGRTNLKDALKQLGEDLNHPSSDMVIAGLVQAAGMQSGRMAPLLDRLASSIRDDADMRIRIAVDRARMNTSSKIVIVMMMLTVGALVVLGRDLVSAYETTGGQLWLLVCGMVIVASLYAMSKLAELPMPDRFVARSREVTTP